jgi:hypothetical protein
MRLVINAIASGLVVLIPQIMILAFLIIKFGINNTAMDIYGAFSGLFYYSKPLYVVLLLILSFVSSAVFSTFALGISSATENKYLTILIPFVYIIISGTIFELIGINKLFSLNIIILFDVMFNGNLTIANVLIYEFILLIIGVALLNYFGERNNYE